MAAKRQDFVTALQAEFVKAERLGLSFIEISSKTLHEKVGGYPGKDHRMPVCCRAMTKAMEAKDTILTEPPSGQGATLLIRYSLPRSRTSA